MAAVNAPIMEVDGSRMPPELAEKKRTTRNAIFLFLKQKLRDERDVEAPINEIQELYRLAEHHIFEGGEMVTAVTISAIKFLMSRSKSKKSWSFKARDVSFVEDRLKNLVKTYGGKPQNLDFRLGQLRSLSSNPCEMRGQILLHADSMFLQAKFRDGVLPIAHSGETAEDLMRLVKVIKVDHPRAVVLNHGLNHTRRYGEPRGTMAAVLSTLKRKYPGVPIFHLETPISPALKNNTMQFRRAEDFNRMMSELGFIAIPHPFLGHRKGEFYSAHDQFHYTRKGLDEVIQHMTSFVDSWLRDN